MAVSDTFGAWLGAAVAVALVLGTLWLSGHNPRSPGAAGAMVGAQTPTPSFDAWDHQMWQATGAVPPLPRGADDQGESSRYSRIIRRTE